MSFINKIFTKLVGQKRKTNSGFENYVFDTNTKYDLQTFQIIKQCLNTSSNSIDVGAHRGDILTKMVEAAPLGKHFAFEPIPELYQYLQKRFKNSTTIFPYALAEYTGMVPFNLVTSNTAYSGLIKRKYDRPEEDTIIEVEVRKLDDIIPSNMEIALVKIDVEGAEFGVIKGAIKILKKWKPIVIYEQGLGASDVYGTDPGMFFDFMEALGYHISLMEYYLLNKDPLSKEEYCSHFWKGYNYYFIAY